MNAKLSLFVICVEAIIYLLLDNFHDCTFNQSPTLDKFTGRSSVSLFHLNICFLSKNTDDLQQLIQTAKTDFDRIVISESRLVNDRLP